MSLRDRRLGACPAVLAVHCWSHPCKCRCRRNGLSAIGARNLAVLLTLRDYRVGSRYFMSGTGPVTAHADVRVFGGSGSTAYEGSAASGRALG
jgi:hypothetical protein